MAERRNINPIGIGRVNDYTPDLTRPFQTYMAPGLARIRGLKHANTVRMLTADVGLARANVDNVRIRRSHGDRTDRANRYALIGDRKPCPARILGLPHAAPNRAEIKRIRLVGMAGNSIRASSAHGTHFAPVQTSQQVARVLGHGSHLLRKNVESNEHS